MRRLSNNHSNPDLQSFKMIYRLNNSSITDELWIINDDQILEHVNQLCNQILKIRFKKVQLQVKNDVFLLICLSSHLSFYIIFQLWLRRMDFY